MSNEHPSTELSGAFGNRSGPRSKNGCYTCRERKVKCDEARPRCGRCIRLSRNCDYVPRQRKRAERHISVSTANHISSQRDGPAMIVTTRESPRISEAIDSPDQVAVRSHHDSIWALSYPRISPLDPLLPAVSSASGLELCTADHEAIMHYRTSFSASQHTKNPQYSVLSIIFGFAELNPMVMHAVLAVAGRHAAYQVSGDSDHSHRSIVASRHYCEAMRLLGKAVQNDTEGNTMETMLAALWLMILYEQRYGDGEGVAISTHLRGAASLLYASAPQLISAARSSAEATVRDASLFSQTNTQMLPYSSYFVSRMIVWMAAADASAASYGLGGDFNKALKRLLGSPVNTGPEAPSNHLLSAIHRHSNPLFRIFWGDSYPQSEIIDDVKSRSVFHLLGECSEIRHSVAELELLDRTDTESLLERASAVESVIESVREKYGEILDIASTLRMREDEDRRFISNLRFVAPHFHAVVLYFYRVTKSLQPLDERQRSSLSEIITMSFLSYKDEGHQALFRMAWPLFMAGLETDDLVHQQWILDRFRGLRKFGKNFARASQLLEAMTKDQDRSSSRADMLLYLESGRYEKFFI